MHAWASFFFLKSVSADWLSYSAPQAAFETPLPSKKWFTLWCVSLYVWVLLWWNKSEELSCTCGSGTRHSLVIFSHFSLPKGELGKAGRPVQLSQQGACWISAVTEHTLHHNITWVSLQNCMERQLLPFIGLGSYLFIYFYLILQRL